VKEEKSGREEAKFLCLSHLPSPTSNAHIVNNAAENLEACVALGKTVCRVQQCNQAEKRREKKTHLSLTGCYSQAAFQVRIQTSKSEKKVLIFQIYIYLLLLIFMTLQDMR